MKTIFAVIILSLSCFGQGRDFTMQGGVIAKTGSKLIVPNSPLRACSDTLNVNTSVTGSFSFVTPTLASGTFQSGGVFNGGGSVTLSANGQYCENFTGIFNPGATWQLVTLANGTHQYTLTGTFTGDAGAFVLLTNNVGKGFFNRAEGVFSINLHLTQ